MGSYIQVHVRARGCPSACVQIARHAMNHIMSKSVKIKHKRIVEVCAEQSMSNQRETWVAVSTEGLHTELKTSLILQGLSVVRNFQANKKNG